MRYGTMLREDKRRVRQLGRDYRRVWKAYICDVLAGYPATARARLDTLEEIDRRIKKILDGEC